MATKNLGRVTGKSAYEVWLAQGNTGSEQDFLNSLKGEGADLSNYYNKQEVDNLIDNVEVDLTGYAKEEDIPTKVSELTNDSKFATETFVTNKIAEAELSGGDVDLSGYATKDDLLTKVDKETGKSLIADSEINRLASVTNYDDTEIKQDITDINQALDKKAEKTEIPTVPTKVSELTNDSGFVTDISGKQDKLVSGTNIKTVNGTSLLGSGNIEISGAGETPYIVLPSKLYAVVGHEFVLYYNNILGAMRPDDFAVTTAFPSGSTLQNREEPYIGAMFEWGLRIMPQEKHIGNHTLTIKVFRRSDWVVVATKAVTLVVSEEKVFSDKKVMFIGDSLTDARVYPAEIERMSNSGIKSIGTLNKSIGFNGGTANVNTEGRSGACSYEYVNDTTIASDYTNPFYNPNKSYTLTLDDKYSGTGVYESVLPVDNSGSKSVITHHFDFEYYMANNGATVGEPDAVFINLGSNCGKKSTYKTAYMSFCAMVDRIRAYSSTLPIFIHLCPPKSEAGSTDRRAGGAVSGWLNERTWFYDITQFFIDKFDNDPRVMVVPTYTMLDPIYDYKRQTIDVSARNSEQITLGQNDGTHPATPGYLHMADSYYNILQALWSGEVTDTYYTVTNNLTNVTNPNTTSLVKEGNSYSTTLTANTGYDLGTVSVTMGEDAVSADNGVINIPSVNGHIVITATAIKQEEPEEPTTNNLVDPSTANDSSRNLSISADEWVNGYYITSSSAASSDGQLVEDDTKKLITTDKIPITDDSVIHIEGLDISSTYKGKTKMVIALASGTLFRSMALPFIESTDGSGSTKLNDDGSLSVTISKFGQATSSSWKGKSWARFCGHPKDGNNANIIVTVE